MLNKANTKIKKVLVVGLGLIGASLCRDLKRNINYEKIYGYDTDKDVMNYALKNDYIDEIKDDLNEGIKNSDLIVLCIPVQGIKEILDVVKKFFNSEKIFTETLSSKRAIIEFLTDNEMLDTKNFILSHPMAGTENFGIKNSKENLFKGANTFICPLEFSESDKLDEVNSLWERVQCYTHKLSLEKHDQLLTYLSHGPHAISFTLSKITPSLSEFPWSTTQGSLAEMTRVANSDPKLWANIFKDNKDNLINYINIFLEDLEILKTILKSQKKEDLLSYLEKSKPKK